MAKIYVINTDQEFVNTLQVYEKFLRKGHEWEFYEPSATIDLLKGEFCLIVNKNPETLDGLNWIQQIRSKPETFPIPIGFVTEPLSDSAQLLYDSYEFIWEIKLPFDSFNFFSSISEISKYFINQQKMLENIQEVSIYIDTRDFLKAKYSIESLEKIYENVTRIELFKAQIELGLGNMEEALQHATIAYERSGRSLEASTLLAKINLQIGQEESYDQISRENTKHSNTQVDNLIHWGDIYLSNGDTKKSISAYNKALKEDPNNKKAQDGILAANIIEGKTSIIEKEKMTTDQSLELARMFNLKGISMAESGNFHTAEKLYSNAIDLLPNPELIYKLWLNLGLCMKKKGDYQKAITYFKKCDVIAPTDYSRAKAQITHLEKLINTHSKKEKKDEPYNNLKARLRKKSNTTDTEKAKEILTDKKDN